jgi:DnaJ-class molecular chaperone
MKSIEPNLSEFELCPVCAGKGSWTCEEKTHVTCSYCKSTGMVTKDDFKGLEGYGGKNLRTINDGDIPF